MPTVLITGGHAGIGFGFEIIGAPKAERGARTVEMTTAERLVMAATALLDRGDEQVVTLRRVGADAGVSHNAPYKHFRNRDALMAAVASADFVM